MLHQALHEACPSSKLSIYESLALPLSLLSAIIFFAGCETEDIFSQLDLIKLRYTVINYPSHHNLWWANSYKYLDFYDLRAYLPSKGLI